LANWQPTDQVAVISGSRVRRLRLSAPSIKTGLKKVITDVTRAVQDWVPMRSKMVDAISDLTVAPVKLAPKDKPKRNPGKSRWGLYVDGLLRSTHTSKSVVEKQARFLRNMGIRVAVRKLTTSPPRRRL